MLNPFEVMQVRIDLQEKGIDHYRLAEGNNCVWVIAGTSSCPLNFYYVFDEGKIVDIQVD